METGAIRFLNSTALFTATFRLPPLIRAYVLAARYEITPHWAPAIIPCVWCAACAVLR